MDKEALKTIKIIFTYLVPATSIVLIQIYYKKAWIGTLQTFSLFFGSILSGVMLTDIIKIAMEINFPEFMSKYGNRMEYFIVGFSVIVGFYLLLFLFAKEEIFKIFNKLNKNDK